MNNTLISRFVLILLFAFSCKAYGQALLDKELMKIDNQPEMLFFEPHYDSNYKITHYTFGDFIKVYYTFDEQERPLWKKAFIWDTDDLRWDKISETTYTYQDDRLVEERTRQVLPHRKGIEVLFLNTTTFLKTLTYNNHWHTDSISTFVYMPPIGYSSAIADASYTVNYYNQDNLVDSTVSRQPSPYDKMVYKEIYHYDEEKRPVKIESFSRENADTASWESLYIIDITYAENRVTYTQTTVYDLTELLGTFIDAGLDISELAGLDEFIAIDKEELNEEEIEHLKKKALAEFRASGKHLKEEKAIFNIEFDPHKRIKERTFNYNGRRMIHDRFSYDVLGRTLVEHEWSMESRFPAYFDRLGLEMEDIPFLKYDITYNDNCRKGIYYTRNWENVLIRSLEMETCFSPEGWILSHSKAIYGDNGEFEGKDRFEYNYFSEYGGSGERIHYKTYNYDDKRVEHIVQQLLFLKDEEDRPLKTFRFDFNDTDSVWLPKARYNYAYDEYGYLTLEEQYLPRLTYDDWKGNYSFEYKYDVDRRVLMRKERVWKDGEWENSIMSNYLYDERNNEKTLVEDYGWDTESQEWVGRRKNTACYNREGKKTELINYVWETSRKEWIPTCKYEILPASDKQEFEQCPVYKYDLSSQLWIPYFLLEKFSADHTDIYLQWNEQKKHWENYAKVIDRGGRNLYTYTWDTIKSEWKEIDFQEGIGFREQLDAIFAGMERTGL